MITDRLKTVVAALIFCAAMTTASPMQAWRIVDNLEPYDRISIARGINVTLLMPEEWEEELERINLRKRGQSLQRRSSQKTKQIPAECPYACVIRAEPTVVKAVECKVVEGRLYIYANPFKYKQTNLINVTVVCDTTLKEIEGESGGNIYSKGCLRLCDLKVKAGFAVDIRLTANARSMDIDARNKSDIILSGDVNRLNARIENSCFLQMKQIRCKTANIFVRKESTAEVCAEESLNIVADKMCEVSYYAPNAAISTKSTEGSFIIERKKWTNM